MPKTPTVEQMSAEMREKGRQAFVAPSQFKGMAYHGTNKDIKSFDPEKSHRHMAWFTDDPEHANKFVAGGRRNMGAKATKGSAVYPVHLALRNPLDLTKYPPGTMVSMQDVLAHAGLPNDNKALQRIAQNALSSKYANVASHIEDPVAYFAKKYAEKARINDMLDNPALLSELKTGGFDSLRSVEDGANIYATFHPHQIKSAIGNRGTYDTTNSDINMNKGGPVSNYQDSPTKAIADWQWQPMKNVKARLDTRRELPKHVEHYAQFMQEMNKKALEGKLTSRDLVKAHTITQSSIGRAGRTHATASSYGLQLPNTGGEIRPEGAFAEWLGSPMGQKYLDAAEKGQVHQAAIDDLVSKFRAFGKYNDQGEAMQYAAETLPNRVAEATQAITGPMSDYRKFSQSLRGVGAAKSGFIASLLGRGDQPTLDARQLDLHSLRYPTKSVGSIMKRQNGLGGTEAVDRLAARQNSLNYRIAPELQPYAQHLIHHDIWDQMGDTQTSHGDLTHAMRHYDDGGSVDEMKQALVTKAKAPKAAPTLPYVLPRAPNMTTAEMQAMVDRIARQQTGEHVTDPGETKNLAGRSKKEVLRLAKNQYELDPIGGVKPAPVVGNQLGDINIALPGDQTISDTMLRSINGLPIHSHQQGGARYGAGKVHLPEDERAFWASNASTAQQFQDKVTELARITGMNPRIIAQHMAMGRVANNFAQHMADANLKAIHSQGFSPENAEIFNNVIREGFSDRHPRTKEKRQIIFPHFPGIENPELAYEAMRKDPEMRKFFNERIKTPTLTKPLGLPNGLDIEHAITEPDFRNMEINLTGHSMGQVVPGAKLRPKSTHATYSHDILGTALGRAQELAPMDLAFPDASAYIRKIKRPADVTGTMQKIFPHQVVDQQYLDQMHDYYYTKLRATRGFAKGGEVSQDQMLASTMLGKKKKGPAPSVKSVGVDEAPDMAVKRFVSPGPGKGNSLPPGGVDFQPQMPGQQLAQAAPGMPQGGPGMPPGAPGLPPPLPRNQPGMPTGKPVGVQAPEIPPPKQKPAMGSNILSMTPQGQALAAMSPMRRMADGGPVTSRAFKEVEAPKATTKAYKLFRTHPKHPGKLFPLFVDANEPIEQGKWLAAQAGEMSGEKVKSKIGPLAYRPGWHAGDLPIATHIGEKSTASLKKPDVRPSNHVWAEVEMPNDVDWHSEAQRRGTNAAGRVVPVKAHITDQLPVGGHYRYKTNANMTGNWLIGGAMKVNRVLPDEEVAAINKAAGTADLPRKKPMDLKQLGFKRGGKVTLAPSVKQMRQALNARRSNTKA